MNLCSYQEFQDADMALDRLYQQQMAALTMPTRVQLKAAQRAWVQFRDASCLYEVGSRAASGTIWPLLQNTCLTGLTRKRIEEMEAYIACDREGCPR